MSSTSPQSSSSDPQKSVDPTDVNAMFPGENPDPSLANDPDVQRQFEDDDTKSARGWMIWIGVLVAANVASWAFDWGYWIY